ncbi:DUF4124 domain-containing protein [Alkalimarinus coralli]|uniref:DUF4124 domain-containing protein n=1 Tax=Alkalimarinus coralli TaxID=2935863 RepID=UPI00202B4981|nr:DUF4124 domain-containing protein [Alkalimarinus coralli]
MKLTYTFFITTAVLASSFITLPSYAGKVYKWTDENGVIHYGDKRPEGAKSETLRVESKSSAPRTSVQDQLKSLEEKQQKENLAKQEQEKSKKAKEQNQLRCTQAKENLQTIENNARIRIEENGELRYMTPEEITAKKDEMNKIVEEACSQN